MKPWMLIAAAVVLWFWWNHQKQTQQNNTRRRPLGVASTTGRGIRQATQFSGTGSTSPGSGVLTMQPAMGSSWGIGGGSVVGMTGPSYLTSGAQRRVGR
jgi:hypothetical protein